VFGATGAQGGSVVKFLLQDGTFKVRAVTRDANSVAAKALVQQGVEVVSGNLEDKASIVNALKGAYGIFGLTNFWEPNVWYEGEIRQGKLLADAAKEAGIQHFVWSTLDHGNVPHFESKALIGDYLNQIGVPTTHLYTSCYFENFLTFPATGFSIDEHGVYNFAAPVIPSSKIPFYAVEDTGAWVSYALLNPKETIGKSLYVIGESLSMNEIVAVFEKVTGKKATALQIDQAGMNEYAKGGIFQQELILNFQYFVDHQEGLRDVEWSKKTYPGVQSWENFLRNHLNKFVK